MKEVFRMYEGGSKVIVDTSGRILHSRAQDSTVRSIDIMQEINRSSLYGRV